MKLLVPHLLTFLFTCFIVTNSCSQKKPTPVETYTGSTPCDSLISALLQIPVTGDNAFIKWELKLQKNNPDTFHLVVHYGESKPNTNGFINDGSKLILTGKYITSIGVNENPTAKVYSLQSDQIKSPLLLIEMDSNILHFLDLNRKFIVGNGGFGYVLNKINP